jgi:hypothetical protein
MSVATIALENKRLLLYNAVLNAKRLISVIWLVSRMLG